MGRPSKLTPETRALIVRSIAAGATRRQAARMAQMTDRTLQNHLAADPAFAADIERAEALLVTGNLALLAKAAQEGDWRAAAFLLERRFPADFGRRAGDATGANLRAAQETVTALRELGRVTAEDNSLVQAFLSMAEAVDRSPQNANLWTRYLDTEQQLRARGAGDGATGDDDDFERLVATLRAPMGDEAPPGAADAGRPDGEARRGDRPAVHAPSAAGRGRRRRDPA